MCYTLMRNILSYIGGNNMKTSIIGYPRIGGLRELKFASEKYFRREITQEELESEAKKIRLYNLNIQKESGIDLIPSNDFSFYDGVLDTAFLFGAGSSCRSHPPHCLR